MTQHTDLDRQLHTRVPFISRWLRTRAADRLLQAGSADALALLIRASASDDADIAALAAETLARRPDWQVVNAVCAAWAEQRHPALADLIRTHAWVATDPPPVRVLSALCAGQEALLTTIRAGMVEPLAHACADSDPQIAAAARRVLRNLARPEAREALCRLAMVGEPLEARAAALDAGYTPRDLRWRALFFLLTGQFEAYDRADPHGSLLGAIYVQAREPLRRRIMAEAERAGRRAWMQGIGTVRRRRRVADLSDPEWQTITTALREGCRYEDAWRLARVAPLRVAERLLNWLGSTEWLPDHVSMPSRFIELVRLARRCPDWPATFGRLHVTMPDHTRGITSLAISPDGRLLACGTGAGDVQLWRLPEGTLVATRRLHPWVVTSLAISPDGRLLASASPVGPIRLWNLPEPGALLAATPQRNPEPLELDGRHPVQFAPDGKVLVSGSATGLIRLWRMPSGDAAAALEGHQGRVLRLAISPDGKLLVSGGGDVATIAQRVRATPADRTVRLWNLTDRTALGVLAEESASVEGLAFSADGRTLVSAGARLHLWRLTEQLQLAGAARTPESGTTSTTLRHTATLRTLEGSAPMVLSPDGSLLAAVASDGALRIWQPNMSELPITPEASPAPVACLAVSPDGGLLAGAGVDGAIWLWDANGRLHGILHGHTGHVAHLAFTPNGLTLISGSADGTARIWACGLARLGSMPASRITQIERTWAQDALRDTRTPTHERSWLEFLLELTYRPRRPAGLTATPNPPICVGELEIDLA